MRTQRYRLGLAALVALALLGGAALASADDGTADADANANAGDLESTDAHDWMGDRAGEHGDHHDGAHQHGDHHASDHEPGVHHGEQHQHDHEAAGACH
ncbi:hypothetical protein CHINAEXTREME_05220 [Halobiforma lacisalsi AJ5]|uniref:Uncharacterized protein n=1 Tax=Natronobacterium lacisalsi AJ5 TaxID=358396 RepID=A0A1P8LN49_NATLA|nr:hypothetical protein [Halobiforma lacisalsi]APW97207.1 hypothetical protein CHINAEXTREME_05220 [Halobiforma lacisalsi AJ5]